jgi:hypothetical protein
MTPSMARSTAAPAGIRTPDHKRYVDRNHNGIPDASEAERNRNGVPDNKEAAPIKTPEKNGNWSRQPERSSTPRNRINPNAIKTATVFRTAGTRTVTATAYRIPGTEIRTTGPKIKRTQTATV